MIKFGIKIMPAVICLLLALLLLPSAGVAYADEGYSLKIIEPADGTTVGPDTFHVGVAWTKPTPPFYIVINVEIKLVSLDNTVPNQELWLAKIKKYGFGSHSQDNGKDSLPENLYDTSLGYAPSGEYEIKAFLHADTYDGKIVATATSTFHFISPNKESGDLPVISFAPDSSNIKVGSNVTLNWKVTGATSISINQGIGAVNAEGRMEVSPINIESPAQAGGKYIARFTLTALNSKGKKAVSSFTVTIEPLTIDEIYAAYEKWGNLPYTWPDGTRDAKALVGPGWCGGSVNIWESATSVTNIGSYESIRWDCNAMQYRSLVFLNEFKKQGKLIGWDYMGVQGAAVFFPSGPYKYHHAAAIWKTGEDWTQTATIFDPFNMQKPARYSVTDGLDSIAPWQPDDYYSEVYPSVPEGEAIKYHQYFLDEFDKNTGNRWGNGVGAKTPWQNPVTFQTWFIKEVKTAWQTNVEKPVETVLDVPLKDLFKMVGLFCPANLLITNSAGQRLGMLSNGSMVTEFKPVAAYYWSEKNGDKQWVFLLPDGTYNLSITGTASGNFRLITYTGGETVNDYGENPIAIGQPAVLSIKPGTVGELTLADGTKVIPEAKAIESFIPVTTPVTSPATTTTSEGNGINLSFIGGIIGVVIVILLLLFLFGRRKK